VQRFLIVCGAGALGSGVRYLVGLWTAQALPGQFPYGTLFVNLAGCFLIALVMQLALDHSSFSETARIGITTGFIGGLTTYSSFNYDATRLLESGQVATGIAYVGITLVGCAITGVAGLALARAL
jgi:CrcB protein